MNTWGDCKSCQHYSDLNLYCHKYRTQVYCSYNLAHYGLLIRSALCKNKQGYKEKIQPEIDYDSVILNDLD